MNLPRIHMIEAASAVKSVSVTPHTRNGGEEFYFTTITMADGTVYRGLRVYPDGSTYYYDPADTDPMHGKVSVPFQALSAKDRKAITDAAVASVQDYPNRHIGVEDLTSIAEKLGYTTEVDGEISRHIYTGESYEAFCAFTADTAWCSIFYLGMSKSQVAYTIKLDPSPADPQYVLETMKNLCRDFDALGKKCTAMLTRKA